MMDPPIRIEVRLYIECPQCRRKMIQDNDMAVCPLSASGCGYEAKLSAAAIQKLAAKNGELAEKLQAVMEEHG